MALSADVSRGSKFDINSRCFESSVALGGSLVFSAGWNASAFLALKVFLCCDLFACARDDLGPAHAAPGLLACVPRWELRYLSTSHACAHLRKGVQHKNTLFCLRFHLWTILTPRERLPLARQDVKRQPTAPHFRSGSCEYIAVGHD